MKAMAERLPRDPRFVSKECWESPIEEVSDTKLAELAVKFTS